ncbi:MAG: HAMP domain-containing protein, partial [Rhodospirillaceae bacterium]
MFNRSILRLGIYARRFRLARRLALALFILALILGVLTAFVLTAPEKNDTVLWLLLNLDAIVILGLTVMVTRFMVRAWSARRAGGAGSRLHARLVLLFGAVAVIPAIVVGGFTAVAFHFSFQTFFDDTVSTAVAESQEVAQAYKEAHISGIAGIAAVLANDLNRELPKLPSEEYLNRYLTTQSFVRNINEVVVFTGTGQVLGRAGVTFSMQFETVSDFALDRARSGDVAVLPGASNDRVRALVALQLPEAFLLVGRFIDPKVRQHIEQADAAVAKYGAFRDQRTQIQIIYMVAFMVVALLLLLAAVWVGLIIADRLARPIEALISASERVREGDLSVRVPEIVASDEVATLSRAFNRMTARISEQQHSLQNANAELDERRRFTETVLSGVSAGVIGLDAEGRMNLPNPSASRLLGRNLENGRGMAIEEAVPAFAELVAKIKAHPERPLSAEVSVLVRDRKRTLLVRVAAEHGAEDIPGYVITFDDVTDLQAAQRTAAWADVARRIAHEIKNPLTPIQLSAERLKRKYLKQIQDDPETFIRCTDTIVRHVSDIGGMVDEFSSFARMPAPVIKLENLNELVAQAVFLQKTAYPQLDVRHHLPDATVRVPCDQRQINQALTNLIKNAIESIEGRPRPSEGEAELPKGSVQV